jgi:hypothetical protein
MEGESSNVVKHKKGNSLQSGQSATITCNTFNKLNKTNPGLAFEKLGS